jgi:deoxyribose-phosphate aldolase
MIRAIRDYQDRTGVKVGYKPAGGIAKAKDALLYLALMKDELGHPGCNPTSSASARPPCWAISNASWNIT